MKSNDHIGCIQIMNFAAFDLNLLRVFDALMRERSATRAGEQIGLSQPAVSAALQRLRDLLDDRLFVRQGNDMKPTPRAESLGPEIREVLAALEQVLGNSKDFDPRNDPRTFTMMGADFFSTILVPDLLEHFSRINAKVTLRFLDSARGDVERLLKDDAIDLALERPLDMPEWISSERLFLSPFKIIISVNHPAIIEKKISTTAPLSLDMFCQLQWAIRSIDGSMTGLVDDALIKIGRQRHVVLAVPHFHALPICVARGKLAAAVPAQLANRVAQMNDLLIFDLPFDVPVPEVKLFWHSRHNRNPANKWLRQQVLNLSQPIANY
jgi:DNA-binding transcriptional LysR family regulator